MKSYFLVICLLFSIFLIPKDVFAEEQSLYIPYYNNVSDYSFEDGENLKNILYNNEAVDKDDNDKCILILNDYYSGLFHLICSPNLNNILFSYNATDNYFYFSLNSVKYYRFSEDYELLFSTSSYIHTMTSNSFENVFLYSDVSFYFIKPNLYDNLKFYNISDSNVIYNTFLFGSSNLYSYKDFYFGNISVEDPTYENNNFHSISKLILGESIPEEFSFLYTISDYLLCLLLVGIVISPIAIIIKIMRW